MPNLKPGALTDWDSSMAKAIEDAYWDLLSEAGKPTFSRTTDTDNDRDRRRLFLAIARGVVRHLAANEDAFVVTHPNVSTHGVDIRTNP